MNHPNLSDELNQAITQGEASWGFSIKDLPDHATVAVQTENTLYTIRKVGDKFVIWGNNKFCEKPTPVTLVGCTFGGSMIKLNHLFEGGYLELIPQDGPWQGRTVTTSRLKTVRIL